MLQKHLHTPEMLYENNVEIFFITMYIFICVLHLIVSSLKCYMTLVDTVATLITYFSCKNTLVHETITLKFISVVDKKKINIPDAIVSIQKTIQCPLVSQFSLSSIDMDIEPRRAA